MIHKACGIYLHEGKRELLRARLAKRMRQGGFRSFRDYYEHVVADDSGMEIIHLLDTVSTNLTHFFREPQHYELLANEVFPRLAAARTQTKSRRLRLWSAGCATGEEPYSMAITALEKLERPEQWKIEIYGTDLSTRALAAAERGVYPLERLAPISTEVKRRYFRKGVNRWKGYARIKPEVRSRVTFMRLNLMEPFPFEKPFDVIFCRNVMIYFDKPTQERLVQEFAGHLYPEGYLFVGHSESLTGIPHQFRYLLPSVYRKQ
jgi:chemotaxis protein methyltransferase CheR